MDALFAVTGLRGGGGSGEGDRMRGEGDCMRREVGEGPFEVGEAIVVEITIMFY